ncbi:MAG: N-6 DNA methylase [Microscillaceae bacterium]|nr:N-6 DNA methylase [Microscillaceae bacterium]
MDLITQGIQKGIISFDHADYTQAKNITYVFQNKKRNYSNPEEKVQAETFCKLILEYGYPEKHIQQFVTVKMGVSDKEADMVVYEDAGFTKPYIVVECKKEDISELEFKEAVKQAFSYAHALAGTTKFVWITKANKEEFYKFDKDKDRKETLADIPYFGETSTKKYKYAKGGFYKDKIKGKDEQIKANELKPISESELTRIFKQAHDALWAGGELNPSQAFDELDKLVFCKIWDEKNTKKGEAYKFQVSAEWFSNDQQEQEQKNLEALKNRIIDLYDKGKTKDPEIFNKPIDLTAERIKTIVEYFQAVNLSDTDLDSKGKAFETFLGTYFRGEFGQFFTPRPVVKFAVDVLPITNESRVLDTSCGSGGFLLYVLDKIRRKAGELYPDYDKDVKEYADWKPYWHDFAQNNLFGIEINDQISRVAKMNMIIHDDGHTNVITFDGLFQIDYIREKSGNKGFKENSFDFIVTNPPFGSIVKQSEKSYMQVEQATAPYYDFALKELNWIDKQLKPKHIATNRENQNTEILFIEQCHKFLREGGYLAIVVPDGILTNSSAQYVRDSIEEKFRIVAVVSLPQTAFTHTGAGVKSSVLFLKKWTKKQTDKIKKDQEELAEHIGKTRALRAKIEAWENEKKDLQKQLKLAKNSQNEIEIQKLEADIEDKNQQIQNFREELEEVYQNERSKLIDYQIFMAIAENIGYDATGKATNQNDLVEITEQLRQFIEAIEVGQDSFFV